MGMPEIQEAPRPSNPWVPMGATVVETGTDALGSLGNRSQGIAFMNGSWMSREVHVQFWERVGVKFPCATHLPLYRQSAILERETGIDLSRATQEMGDEQFCFVEGCQRSWDELPAPDGPLTVGIDGGYVRGRHKQGQFEVIAGKSILAFERDQEGKQELSGRCFAWVQTYDEKPKRRLFELLKSQGMQPNQQVDFLSDGGEDVRNVQLYLNPQAEHLLDWFPNIFSNLSFSFGNVCLISLEKDGKISSEIRR